MIKKLFLKSAAGAAAALMSFSLFSLNASAASIDDVAATARRLGFPESVIQQGINQYYEDPDLYTSDVLDDAIAYLYQYEDDLKSQLGITDTQTSTEADTTEQQTSTAAQNTESAETTADKSAGNTQDSTSETTTSANQSEYIDESDFSDMTLEEKRSYISSLDSEQQQEFFNSLSADTLKGIVKQLPADDKASVVDTFVKAGETMGIQVTVDEMTDDKISMSMRNSDGELIDVASVGVIVENTGYDYRGIYISAAALVLLSAGGIWLIIRKCFGKKGDC